MIAGNTSSLTYHMYDMGIEEALETFLELGFTNLEICHNYPLNSLKKFSGSINFPSYHHYTRLNLDTEFDKFKEELRQPLKICDELNVDYLSFHPFYESSFEDAVSNISSLNDDIGPEIIIENATKGSERRLVVTPSDYQRLVDMGSEIGLLLDVGHAYEIGVEKFMKFDERIKEIHLQDAFSEEDIHHLPLGAGDIDFEFLKRLRGKIWVLELKWATKELLKISRLKAEKFL